MASLFGQVLGDACIAGHWREDLQRTLIWAVSPEDKPSSNITASATVTETYIAPSWSWASSPWKVNILIDPGRPFSGALEIHDIKVTTIG